MVDVPSRIVWHSVSQMRYHRRDSRAPATGSILGTSVLTSTSLALAAGSADRRLMIVQPNFAASSVTIFFWLLSSTLLSGVWEYFGAETIGDVPILRRTSSPT